MIIKIEAGFYRTKNLESELLQMHVSRKPGVYGQIELKTRIHRRRHKLSHPESQSFKESELFYFPAIAYDLRGEKQESEAAKSGRINQTYTMLVPSASK